MLSGRLLTSIFRSRAALMSITQYRPSRSESTEPSELFRTILTPRHSSKDPKSVNVPSNIPLGGLPDASNTEMNSWPSLVAGL